MPSSKRTNYFNTSLLSLSMKKITLIRHAKSDWGNTNLSDFDRTLNKRGKEQLPIMLNSLQQNKIIPEVIYCSAAKRTQLTSNALFPNKKSTYLEELYQADVKTLLQVVNSAPASLKSIAIIAHNPGLSYFIEYITGKAFGNLSTCAIVELSFHVNSFDEISAGLGTITFYDYPKNHGV
jgi:phosphohistidine phosphatase